jgi:glycine/D-amino acid oxidase-like deaminating enzyme
MATEKRHLRSGRSVWTEPRPLGKTLTGDLGVDVLIIGGGVTGVLVAERLSREFAVAVVDQRGPARGSTTGSTGLLLFEIDTPLIKLREKIGRDAADRAWRRSDQAMRELMDRIEENGIDCGMTRCASIYLPGDVLGPDDLREEARARAECGLPSQWIDEKELKSRLAVQGDAAIVSGDSAKVDPVRFALGFLERAIASGTRCFGNVEVIGLHPCGESVIATTKSGPKISARHVVFATGYELPEYLSAPGGEIASTWVVATVQQPLGPDIHSALVWEAADPYHYVRTTDDGRVIIGGEDEGFDDKEKREALTPEKAKKLQEKLGALFPALNTSLEYVWSGAFGRTESGLPMMGVLPGMDNCYAILGFGGSGMTYGMIGSQLVERQIKGQADPDADLFRFRK